MKQFFGLVMLSILASCSSVYMPNVPNTALLSKANQFHGEAHITAKGNISVNTAYALSDHLGVLVNGSTMNNERRKLDFQHQLVEGAIGYFTTFGADRTQIFEAYGGIGTGGSKRVYHTYLTDGSVIDEVQDVNFDKLFMQVNYSSKEKKNLTLFKKKYPLSYGTALRLSVMDMSNFTIDGVKQANEDNVFIEPVFFTRMRVSPALSLQYTSGSNFGLKNRKYLTAGNSVFSIGIIYSRK